jgi:O-antigen ligase
MLNSIIKILLALLLIFTPIAFGSVELWAFSLMELGILLILVLAAVQRLSPSSGSSSHSALRTPHSAFAILLLFLFLALLLFQMIPLPAGLLKVISPKTYQLRLELSPPGLDPSASSFQLSFLPFMTQIEFIKWLVLGGLFLFLLHWRPFEKGQRTIIQLVLAVVAVGIFESFYGMFEYFSGHRHILYLEGSSLITSVTGTFINRNYFAGYLLLVIPLSVGFFLSRETYEKTEITGWRERLSSLDGRTLLLGFGIILMVLGLLFSSSRMGIASLLLSFTFVSLVFRGTRKGRGFTRKSFLILGLALLWAAWIGLDVVINRFFSTSEDFKTRWMIWLNAYQIFKDFPIFGSGLGTFAQIFPMYRSFHVQGLVTHAENDFLQLAAEVGLIGVGILFLLFLLLFFKSASGIRALSANDPRRYIGTGGLVSILALMFHSVVERNIQVPSNAFLFTIIMAMVVTISRKSVKADSVNELIRE